MDPGAVIDGIFNSLLKSTGGLADIERAIATKDLAAVVKAATGALRKTMSIPMVITERKSAELSNNFRREGNIHYINKEYKEAIECFNKALAYAPTGSLEVKLAYSNISAVLLSIRAFRDCQANIKAAQALDCPEFLSVKLEKRMIESDQLLMMEMVRDMMIADKGLLDYANFDVERNPDIPCASTDVSVDDGQNVVAARDIKSGTMVSFERAFVSVQDDYEPYTSCYYCHRLCLFFIPCEGCCKALFCSPECREKCFEEYHRIECHIVAYMGTMYRRDTHKLAIRAAIKLSLKLGWEKLTVASQEMGAKRLKKSSVNEAFDVNNPLSILSYDDQIDVLNETMVLASVMSASAMYCLGRVPDYLPTGQKKREKAVAALSRIMLHLNTTFLRKIRMGSSSFDYSNEAYRCEVQHSAGWFSLASKLAHSCEPNMLAVGFNDHVGLVALQRVKKGDPLTISFVDMYYDIKLHGPKKSFIRQRQIFNYMQYTCECRVCLLEWDKTSLVHFTLSKRRNMAYNQCKIAVNSRKFDVQIKAIGAALDEFTGCFNTTQHYDLYGELRRSLNICQCAKGLSRSYGCVSKYLTPV